LRPHWKADIAVCVLAFNFSFAMEVYSLNAERI
jgi:hypothetical protein